MRVLVTGAAGRIGRVLSQGLRPEFDLRLSDRVACSEWPADAEILLGDITDDSDVAAMCAGMDAVVHLAGHPNSTDWDVVRKLNINGTRRVFEAAGQAGARKIIYASSVHVAGYADAGACLTGQMPYRPDGAYGVSKAVGELLLQYASDHYGLAGVALRICAFRDQPGTARELRLWISPGDIVRLVRAALNAGGTGFSTVWGISNNGPASIDRSAWNTIGYAPQDDAADHAGALLAAGVDTGAVSEWPFLGGAFIGQ